MEASALGLTGTQEKIGSCPCMSVYSVVFLVGGLVKGQSSFKEVIPNILTDPCGVEVTTAALYWIPLRFECKQVTDSQKFFFWFSQ